MKHYGSRQGQKLVAAFTRRGGKNGSMVSFQPVLGRASDHDFVNGFVPYWVCNLGCAVSLQSSEIIPCMSDNKEGFNTFAGHDEYAWIYTSGRS